MPNDRELEALMGDAESDRVERKESLADLEKIRRTVCAFANDMPGHGLPGYLFIGVGDDGRPVPFVINDRTLTTLADVRSDGQMLPPPRLNVEKRSLCGASIAVVEVHPSDAPPVRYRGRVWVRVGPSVRVATAEEERRLAERSLAALRTFDQLPCPGASLEDILTEPFQEEYLPRLVSAETITQNGRAVEEQLASVRLFDLKTKQPTHAGILLLGKDPLNFLPGAYIQFVRFDGAELSDAVQQEKAITGNLMTQLSKLGDLLPIQIHTARTPGGDIRHEQSADYPLPAIREIALNAVLHRTYEGTNAPVRINWFTDRIEISSPGGLYGQVTPENYERVSDYRNPILAEGLKTLGYVERFGTGIARAKQEMKTNGNPLPEFTFEATHVLVTIRTRS